MLFLFEQRAIANVLRDGRLGWNRSIPELYKYEGLAGSLSSFNEDYSLQFMDIRELPDSSKSTFSELLPCTIGAELFVTVDIDSGLLCMAELLGGEVFPANQYRQFLTLLATELRKANVPSTWNVPIHPGLSTATPVSWRQLLTWPVVYAWVINGELCFFLGERQVWTARDPAALRLDLRGDDNAHFAAHIDSGRIAAIEGWMRVPVFESEWKLMAVADE